LHRTSSPAPFHHYWQEQIKKGTSLAFPSPRNLCSLLKRKQHPEKQALFPAPAGKEVPRIAILPDALGKTPTPPGKRQDDTMTTLCRIMLLALLLLPTSAWASNRPAAKTLYVYGPGGPHHVIKECAERFRDRHGVNVAVIKAMPSELERRLSQNGDIYFGGAEYMLEDFHQRNPDVLDMTSVTYLHPRRIGILVRKGNPLEIRGIEDLTRRDVDLLDVKLENMRTFHSEDGALSTNVWSLQYTGQQGVEAWLGSHEIDAWVTYRSWHVHLMDESDFIEIPGEHGIRYTPIAVTHNTPLRQEALNFINFLTSEEGRLIFEDHGWY